MPPAEKERPLAAVRATPPQSPSQHRRDEMGSTLSLRKGIVRHGLLGPTPAIELAEDPGELDGLVRRQHPEQLLLRFLLNLHPARV